MACRPETRPCCCPVSTPCGARTPQPVCGPRPAPAWTAVRGVPTITGPRALAAAQLVARHGASGVAWRTVSCALPQQPVTARARMACHDRGHVRCRKAGAYQEED